MKRNSKNNQHGFSMVELMVGTVISLLVSLTVASSAQFLDVQQRIMVGSNGVLENLAIAHREVSTILKMASYGVYGCEETDIQASIYSGSSALSYTDLEQVFITNNDNGSDTITVFHGESETGNSYSLVDTASPNEITLFGYVGQLKVNKLLLIRNSIPPAPASKCHIAKVTGISTNTITIVDDTLNGSGHTGEFLDNNRSSVTGLSDISYSTISVINNNLQVFNGIKNTTEVISSDIVYFKAYYGLSDGTFVPAKGDWASLNKLVNPDGTIVVGSINYIKSLRIFMVSRSPILNKKVKVGDDNICDTTKETELVSWLGHNSDGTLNSALDGPIYDISELTDGKCYRYKSIDFIAPLKNKVLFDLAPKY